MRDLEYIYGGISIILRYLFYITFPVALGVLIYKLVVGIKSKGRTVVLKRLLILMLALVVTIMCFVSIPSLPVSIKTKNISDIAAKFEQVSAGHYTFTFGCCDGDAFVYEYENREQTHEKVSDFAEYYETDINKINGIEFSKTSYECMRASYENAGFLAGIEADCGALVGLACETKYVEIRYSYFTSGLGSVFRGLIPLDMIIRPRLDLLKVYNNMESYIEPEAEDFEVPNL